MVVLMGVEAVDVDKKVRMANAAVQAGWSDAWQVPVVFFRNHRRHPSWWGV
jgi:hypothetical protein